MDRVRYGEIVGGFAGRSLMVLGDLMMDEYLWGRATRISAESPVMVVEVDRESSVPGGAANVVNNLLALGAKVAVFGVVGDDAAGEALVGALQERGADVDGILVDSSRMTTRKTRIVAQHHHQVVRVDREQTHPISDALAVTLLDRLRSHVGSAQAILVSEYNKGVLHPRVAHEAVQMARKQGILLTANPKPPNARMLAGAHLLQLNQREAEAISGDKRFSQEKTWEEAGAALVKELGIETLLVTRGGKGFSLWHAQGGVHHIPPHLVELYDEAGAGDTVISTLTLGLTTGVPVEDAAVVANHAAACVVRKVGVATVTPEELLADW